MFRPNTKCKLKRRLATRNIFGKTSYAFGITVPCSVVKLEMTADHSSVRADSSASRASADQEQAAAVLLLPANVKVKLNDVVTIMGVDIRITKLVPRLDAAGRYDHNEVAGVIKEQSE